MQERKQKWLPSYRAITILSLLAAVLVSSAFIWFNVSFYLAEKAISRPTHPAVVEKDAFRVLIVADFPEPSKSPIEVGMLSYLSKKLDKKVVPVERETIASIDKVLIQGDFDIALISAKTNLNAATRSDIDALVISVPTDSFTTSLAISARKDLDTSTKEKIKNIFLNMNKDSSGKKILAKLEIVSFVEPNSLGDRIRESESGN